MSNESPLEQEEEDVASISSIDDVTATSVAQSVAFSLQNEVDALRNQNTVNMVAMGSAYAKWLENPAMGQEFEKIIENTALKSETILGPHSPARNKEVQDPAPRLATSIFSRIFLRRPSK